MNTCSLILAFSVAAGVFAQTSLMPGAKPLELQGDLSAQMVAGIDQFLTADTSASA
jgi:hypothetical protein